MDSSTPGFPVLHYLLDFVQAHVHWVDDVIQPSHLLSSPSSSALNLSEHQDLFQWVSIRLPKYWRFSFIIRPSNEGLPFIRRLFSFSLFLSLRWYHLHIWGYWYVSIPACDSSSPTFWMTHFTCKLNKQDDNIQPWHTSFPVLNQSPDPCLVLTVASWPAYRFLRRQERWSGIPISLRIFQFVVIHTKTLAQSMKQK